MIEFDNSYLLIIENKIKSLPNKEQLNITKQEFDNTKEKNFKNKKKFYLLLSLSEPLFNIEEIGWQFISYKEFNKYLKLKRETVKDKYHNRILDDYCNFVSDLEEIDNLIKIDFKHEFYNFHIYNNEPLKTLKDLRIHDLYLKKKYSILAFNLCEKVTKDKFLKDFKIYHSSNSSDWKDYIENSVWVNSGFFHQSPLFEIGYIIKSNGKKRNLAMGIQVQGEYYTAFVLSESDDYAIKVAECLYDKKLFFDFSGITKITKDTTEYPIRDNLIFRHYHRNNEYMFLYRAVKLGTGVKVKQLIENTLTNIKLIISNRTKILNAISKI
ncbi:MAG: hypothetical protein A2220_00085 [Ignavibacteria bacterium RIFOXYA2_FULL_35_10]|nr:MAG: hypothetical protein A2220_00085 [Ignavibacteria bacterium RIFOXYA2_FULL_35_10]